MWIIKWVLICLRVLSVCPTFVRSKYHWKKMLFFSQMDLVISPRGLIVPLDYTNRTFNRLHSEGLHSVIWSTRNLLDTASLLTPLLPSLSRLIRLAVSTWSPGCGIGTHWMWEVCSLLDGCCHSACKHNTEYVLLQSFMTLSFKDSSRIAVLLRSCSAITSWVLNFFKYNFYLTALNFLKH